MAARQAAVGIVVSVSWGVFEFAVQVESWTEAVVGSAAGVQAREGAHHLASTTRLSSPSSGGRTQLMAQPHSQQCYSH